MGSTRHRSLSLTQPPAVHLSCTQCDSQLGTFENEWIRLTTSYARAKHSGDHVGTEVGNRIQYVPAGLSQKSAEGCAMAEIFCKECSNLVGQYCKSAPTKEKEKLVDNYFYKLSRTYLLDPSTNQRVEPVFGYEGDLAMPPPRPRQSLRPNARPSMTIDRPPRPSLLLTPRDSLGTFGEPNSICRESVDRVSLAEMREDSVVAERLTDLERRISDNEVALLQRRGGSVLPASRLGYQSQEDSSQERSLSQQTTDQDSVVLDQQKQITALTGQIETLQGTVQDLRHLIQDLRSQGVKEVQSPTQPTSIPQGGDFMSSFESMVKAVRSAHGQESELARLRDENKQLRAKFVMLETAVGLAPGSISGLNASSGVNANSGKTSFALGKRKRDDDHEVQVPTPDSSQMSDPSYTAAPEKTTTIVNLQMDDDAVQLEGDNENPNGGLGAETNQPARIDALVQDTVSQINKASQVDTAPRKVSLPLARQQLPGRPITQPDVQNNTLTYPKSSRVHTPPVPACDAPGPALENLAGHKVNNNQAAGTALMLNNGHASAQRGSQSTRSDSRPDQLTSANGSMFGVIKPVTQKAVKRAVTEAIKLTSNLPPAEVVEFSDDEDPDPYPKERLPKQSGDTPLTGLHLGRGRAGPPAAPGASPWSQITPPELNGDTNSSRRSHSAESGPEPKIVVKDANIVTPEEYIRRIENKEKAPKERKEIVQTTEKLLNEELRELGLYEWIGRDKNSKDYRIAIDGARAYQRERRKQEALAKAGIQPPEHASSLLPAVPEVLAEDVTPAIPKSRYYKIKRPRQRNSTAKEPLSDVTNQQKLNVATRRSKRQKTQASEEPQKTQASVDSQKTQASQEPEKSVEIADVSVKKLTKRVVRSRKGQASVVEHDADVEADACVKTRGRTQKEAIERLDRLAEETMIMELEECI